MIPSREYNMKNSILIALLGLTVAVVTPSVSYADSDFKFGPGKGHNKAQKYSHNNGHNKKHGHKQRHVVKKHHKKHHNKHKQHNRRHDVARFDAKKHHHSKRHHYKSKQPSFSITFSNDYPSIVYGHDYYEDRVYRDHNGYRSHIYQRMDNQARRIRKGIKSGQLVRREVRKLRDEQYHIERKLVKYDRDGRLNRHERSRLNQMLDDASHHIRNKRHNHLTRDSIRHQRDYEYVYY